jgi:predicted phage terminase large subunit-like protein
MPTKNEILESRRRWEQHCRYVQSMTVIPERVAQETIGEKQRRLTALQNNYAAFCEYYFPHFLALRDKVTGEVVRTVHNAPFHNAAAKKVLTTPDLKAVFMWPRGHAKSTHFDIFIPLWLMLRQNRLINVMVLVGKSQESSNTLLSDIQSELEFNRRIIEDYGDQKNVGSWEEGEFVTQNGVAFFARGRGQSPRGLRYKEARPDYIVIDDLDDDELCRNEARVNQLTDWVKEALFGALDAGRGRFIMVGNLISKTSVLDNISKTPGVFLSRITAVDKDGSPVWAEKWTKQEAESAAQFMGYRAWQKEMMHNPITMGAIFKYDWIRYKKMLSLDKYDELIVYVDPSFKSTTKNDYKACRFWAKTGKELHLIDTYVRQDTVTGMVRWLYNLYESLPEKCAVRFFMEANFMQDIILDEFATEGVTRGYQLPIMPDKRQKPDKLQRIEAISPLWERGFIFYNEALKDSPDMIAGIEQTLALERGSHAHDDAPDADEGAIYILQKMTRQELFTPSFGRRPSAKNSW